MSRITGRVVDYDNDSPIQDTLIQGVSKDGTVFATTTSSDDGTYVMENSGLDDPYARVFFSRDGYGSQNMQPASANNVDVVLAKSGTLASVTLTLKRNKTKAILFALAGALVVYLYIKYKNQIKI